jgi:hypothetical protein
MITFLLLLLIPIFWFSIAKIVLHRTLNWKEFSIGMVVTVVVLAIVYYSGLYSQTLDVQIINGEVKSKEKERVSCEHSYSCNCSESCSGSGANRTCSTTCQTCYEHLYDYSWRVHTTVGTITINRIDRQGSQEPPRFSIVQPGQPVALTESYTNYIKGAPDSLFYNKILDQKAMSKVPAYPSNVYDYHYVDRVLSVGVNLPDHKQWNLDLANLLKVLGPQKQANVVIMFVNSSDPNFAKSVEQSWLGGKKNDIILIVGTPEYPNIQWASVLSWTKKELFKVQLRDDVVDLKIVDRKKIMDVIYSNTLKKF